MSSRRKFIKISALSATGLAGYGAFAKPHSDPLFLAGNPIVVSTWDHGMAANKVAWEVLKSGGKAIDAVEKGVMVSESDPDEHSVGLGGLPDREGKVTLDACIMDEQGNCGAVAFLQDIENPIAVARKIMDDTPHVMIVGSGAKAFALKKGFKATNLLTDKAKEHWQNWLKKAEYHPRINMENHDTIGMLALDALGNLSGACTTSGLSYKMHGRVGDSPIIGAGMYVDNEVGGACATGVGEEVIKIVGSHLVVEMMRQGKEPGDACKLAVERIMKRHQDMKDMQVGFLALRKDGSCGAYGVYNGYNYAVTTEGKHELMDAEYALKQ